MNPPNQTLIEVCLSGNQTKNEFKYGWSNLNEWLANWRKKRFVGVNLNGMQWNERMSGLMKAEMNDHKSKNVIN